jgi:hypothetical protein
MLRVLSKEEELEGRKRNFARIKPGSLFNLGMERFFIAVKKIDDQVWEVIELSQANKKKIISNQPCEHTTLHFDEMHCLNLR